jgi:hypothetical protein
MATRAIISRDSQQNIHETHYKSILSSGCAPRPIAAHAGAIFEPSPSLGLATYFLFERVGKNAECRLGGIITNKLLATIGK